MGVRLNVINGYLEEQQDLRAALRFSKVHEKGLKSEQGIYESMIPLSKPGPGQQYGFQVDLDACTGCKACVVGCNKMNGLDPGEAWRSVGLVHGGTAAAPVQQTVTTACHHCLDPACMNGCPVGAYEKDPSTGIVKHLDDQCIGCQYCTLTCPYEVPQYNKRLGIVRKCDMCSDRLAADEAPACVQSCPNGAITIKIVETREVLDDAQGHAFLPGAPSPGITAPTTTFKSKRRMPQNALPADFYSVRPADKHLPLGVMLVLTQLSAGAFAVDALLNLDESRGFALLLGRAHSLLALSLGLLALGAATFHLGRPQFAFRAFIGLRRSWMSREIVAFGGFVKLALLYAVSYFRPEWFVALGLPALFGISSDALSHALALATAGTGAFAVFCSGMIYVTTKRLFWNATATMLKFFGTAAILGLGALLLTVSFCAWLDPSSARDVPIHGLTLTLAAVGGIKLLYELSIFLHLFDKQQGDLKRSALLMRGPLRDLTASRFALGFVGALLIPLLLAGSPSLPMTGGRLVATFSCLVLLLVGELLERVLFFMAVSAPRMPGGVGK